MAITIFLIHYMQTCGRLIEQILCNFNDNFGFQVHITQFVIRFQLAKTDVKLKREHN